MCASRGSQSPDPRHARLCAPPITRSPKNRGSSEFLASGGHHHPTAPRHARLCPPPSVHVPHHPTTNHPLPATPQLTAIMMVRSRSRGATTVRDTAPATPPASSRSCGGSAGAGVPRLACRGRPPLHLPSGLSQQAVQAPTPHAPEQSTPTTHAQAGSSQALRCQQSSRALANRALTSGWLAGRALPSPGAGWAARAPAGIPYW